MQPSSEGGEGAEEQGDGEGTVAQELGLVAGLHGPHLWSCLTSSC